MGCISSFDCYSFNILTKAFRNIDSIKIIKQQLTKANGATVDYQSLNLDLTNAKLEIIGLGAADPNDLSKDRFYAQSVSASIDISNLLTRQITIKDVVITGVALDKQRTTCTLIQNSWLHNNLRLVQRL